MPTQSFMRFDFCLVSKPHPRSSGRRNTVGYALSAILLCFCAQASASSSYIGCSKFTDYRIVNSTTLLVQCAKPYTTAPNALSLKLFLVQDLGISEQPLDLRSSLLTGTTDWITVTLTAQPGQAFSGIVGGKHYTLGLLDTSSVPNSVTKIDLDATSLATIAQDPADPSGHTFIINSHTAFPPQGPAGITVAIHSFTDVSRPLSARITIDSPIDPRNTDPLRGIVSPTSLGSATFRLNHQILFHSQVAFQLAGLVDALGQNVQPKLTDRVKLPQAPTTKTLSTLYLKGDYAAGSGAKPAWVLEGKLTPKFVKPFGGWQFYPDLEADIGHNSIANIKYTDTVDFGFALGREDDTRFAAARNIGLQHLSTTAGFTYETDRELDRDNVLGTGSVLLRFAHLYETQQAKKSDALDRAKKAVQNKGFEPQSEDLSSPSFGYDLDFSFITEAGSAIKDTTTAATIGKATIAVPSYGIARVGPQVHGQLQIWNVSLDVKATGRFLAVSENTVRQLKDNSLVLLPVNEWQAYEEANASWAVDANGHLSLNLSYKNGFAPPKFSRVNTVQVGILLKY